MRVEALAAGLVAARDGRLVSDIGRAVSARADAAGFAVVRELCGHGVGRQSTSSPKCRTIQIVFHGSG